MTGRESTETLLDRLAADAKARGAVRPWPYRLLVFFAIASSTVAVALGLAFAGTAIDLPSGDGARAGWWALAAAAALFLTAVTAALRLAIPGRAVGGMLRYVAGLATFALIFAVAGRELPVGTTFAHGLAGGWPCTLTLLGFSVAPLAMIAIALRTGAPASPDRAALWTALAGAALAVVATDLACPSAHPAHLAVYHLGAALLVTVAAALLLRRWLRW